LELGNVAVVHRSFGVTVCGGGSTGAAGAGPVDVVDVVETAYGPRALLATVEAAGTAGRAAAAGLVSAFRTCVGEAALEDVAAALDQTVARTSGAPVSAGALLTEVGPQGDVAVVNCGHPEPLLLYAAGGAIPLRTTRGTTALGRRPQPARDEYHLQRGEAVLCFSPGVTRAGGGDSGVFDVVTHCRRAVGDLLDPVAVADCVFRDLFVHFGGAVEHDASLLVLHRRD
jgi:serine phosphatase RsbU (regulator of sigma subunit)